MTICHISYELYKRLNKIFGTFKKIVCIIWNMVKSDLPHTSDKVLRNVQKNLIVANEDNLGKESLS